MANEEQLSILMQGVEVWNKWRSENLFVEIDLSNSNFHVDFPDPYLREGNLVGANFIKANLSGADLRGVRLSGANLSEANLSRANLRGAYLSRANLSEVNFSEANLGKANLERVNLMGANLERVDLEDAYLEGTCLIGAVLESANLEGADLREAELSSARLFSATMVDVDLTGSNLREVDLSEANLSSASLFRANLIDVELYGTNLINAGIGETIFVNIDFSETRGLQEIRHSSPSSIDSRTLQRSKGKFPESFLRGCGLADWEIESVKLYNPELSNEEKNGILYKMYELLAGQALQISPLFISYSQTDGTFVDKLESQLIERGIRFWRDIHDMKSGKMEKQIDRAIRQNPTVLLVLSEHSLSSDWVEYEVRAARQLEKDMGRDVLCPVALDDSWKSSPWPKRVMEQIMEYNILDFSAWEDESKFEGMFRKLIDGLELFYKG